MFSFKGFNPQPRLGWSAHQQGTLLTFSAANVVLLEPVAGRRSTALDPAPGGSSGASSGGRRVDVAATPAPVSVLDTIKGGFFYPRIITSSGAQLDFTTPASPLISEGRIKGENVSLAGFQETLSVRVEPRLTLGFTILSRANLIEVRDWWMEWASLGRQSAVILDRFDTCGGQYEYDLFNTTFDKAHCLYNPFEPRRFTVSRQLFTVQLTFRQGQTE